MTDVNQQFNQLRKKLYGIIEASSEQSAVKSEINQYLKVEDDTFKDLNGNVIIIQNAVINSQIINQGTKALKVLDDLQKNYIETDGLTPTIQELHLRGISAFDIIEIVRNVCVSIADRTAKNTTEAAKSLGIKRTTLIAWRKRPRLKQLTIKQGE